MTERTTRSAMAREISEIPESTERLLSRVKLFSSISRRVEQARPQIVVFCGRGSSGHVGVYLRYLFEARLGLVGSAAAPSVVTAYRRPQNLHNALWIVISQSGRSPDLVAATEMARKAGALTLALVNDEISPVASMCELVLPIDAGTEQSVAATKTVVLSMIAGATLVAELANEADLKDALSELPVRMSNALQCDWSVWADRAAFAPAAFVVGRGYGLGCAREIALKVSETLRVPALGYSAAELRHGPRASISPTTPVLFLRQSDASAAAVDDLFQDLQREGDLVCSAGGPAGTLPWIGDSHPALDPALMLIPAYRAIESAAINKGLDPDNPPHLTKVTHTL